MTDYENNDSGMDKARQDKQRKLAESLNSLNASEKPKTTVKRRSRAEVKEADKAPKYVEMPKLPPVDYDHALVDQYLRTIFHSEFEAEEEICCYFDPLEKQGFPLDEETFLKKIERTHAPAKLYVGTATVKRDEEGNLRNRKNLFVRSHMLTLDDIGTKVDPSIYPEGFTPTTILESSAGNFQYNYVFEEPIDDYDAARALVDIIYSAGFSDEGGKLVTKKVRLPEGIHGKLESPDPSFRTRMVSMDGPRWTPQALLDALCLNVSWDDILEDANAVRREKAQHLGAGLWSPMHANHMTTDGTIDPMLEWLEEEGYVIAYDNAWVEISCPWSNLHTDGGESAYYSPLGMGEEPTKRFFNCFHSHGHKTPDFIDELVRRGAPEVPIHDPAAHLVTSHVYDATGDTVWNIKTKPFSNKYGSLGAFTNTYVKTVSYKTLHNEKREPKWKYTTVADLWKRHPARVTAHGTTFDPSTRARLVESDGALRVNLFAMPDHGDGPYDQRHVDMFLSHVNYLMPNKEERDVWLMWLAAKYQNPAFRGWGMVMMAKQQGTGRGTLSRIIRDIFHARNCSEANMTVLTGSGDFNEWQGKPIVFTNEALQEKTGGKFFQAYNRLKEVIDTTSSRITINPKFGTKYDMDSCSSHMIFTNYEAGAIIERGDRRLYCIENVSQRNTPEYFTRLYAWINEQDENGEPAHAKHIARWLAAQEVDLELLNSPARSTLLKEEMIDACESALDVTVDAILNAHTGCYIANSKINAVLDIVGPRLKLDEMPNADKVVKHVIQHRTTALHSSLVIKVDGKSQRVRAINSKINPVQLFNARQNAPDPHTKAKIASDVNLVPVADLVVAVNNELDLKNF